LKVSEFGEIIRVFRFFVREFSKLIGLGVP